MANQITGPTRIQMRNVNLDEEAGFLPEEGSSLLEKEEEEEQEQEEQRQEKEQEEKEEGDGLWNFAPYSLQREKKEGREVEITEWGGIHIVGFVGGAVLFFLFFAFFSFGYFRNRSGLSANAAEILLFLGFPLLWIGGWPLYLSWSQGNGPMLDFGITFRSKDFGWGILFGFVAIGVNFLLVILCQSAFRFMAPFAWSILEPKGVLATITMILIVGVGYPLFDEILLRGLFFTIICQKNLSKKKSPALVIFLSSFLSAVLHVELWRAPIYFCVAIVFGCARLFSESVTAPIIAHMMCNFTIIITFLLFKGDYADDDMDYQNDYRTVNALGSLLGF